MKVVPWLAFFGFLLIATPVLTAAEKVHSIAFKGVERTFRVFDPEHGTGGSEQAFASPFPVVLALHGGGHTWPGRARAERLLAKATANINANDIIWEFFSHHSLKQGSTR